MVQQLVIDTYVYPQGALPEEYIYPYSTEGPRAIRKSRPRGEVDMDYIH